MNRTRKPILFSVVLLLAGAAPWTAERVAAQSVDACLQLAQRTPQYLGWGNTDSVMVDTCEQSVTFDSIYCDQAYAIQFQYAVIPLDSLPADSIVPGGWHAIDTTYAETRTIFRFMDSIYGGIRIKLTLMTLDTNWLGSKIYTLTLGRFVPVDSFVNYLKSIPNVANAYFFGYPVAGALSGNGRDSCLELAENVMRHQDPELMDSTILNPDSTMIDTCQNSDSFTSVYSKRSWYIQFQYAAITLPPILTDTVLEVPWKYIQDAYPLTRTAFAHLDSTFGGLWLRKVYPANGDSTSSDYKTFEVVFNDYQSRDSIFNILSSIPLISKVWWAGQPIIVHANESVRSNAAAATKLRMSVQSDGKYFVEGLLAAADYSIFDICGRVVRRGRVNPLGPLDIEGLARGPYFLQIQSEFMGPFCFQN